MHIKKTKTEKTFNLISIIIILITLVLALMPMLYIVALSLSSKNAILSGTVSFFPKEITLSAYSAIMKNKSIIKSLGFTVVLTVVTTVLSMFMTICAAYPLTRKDLKGKTWLLSIMLFTMYFGGGMIPEYILMKNLKLLNTMWVLILPGMISVYNMIILRTFFSTIPASLEESAKLDGCSDIGILIRIILPLSKPVLATLSLFYAVGRWNGFQDALIYITKPEIYPIQLKLYQITASLSDSELLNEGAQAAVLIAESVKAASIVVATIPILLIYPKLQKYFMSGVMIGAVKG